MKKIMKLLMIISAIVMLLPFSVKALVVDDWEVEISNGEAYIIGYNGQCSEQMTLPTQIGNFHVVGLKSNIFTENVTEIIIPEGYRVISMKMSVIGDYLGTIKNKLEKITLPSTLEIMEFNFKNCQKLKEIRIPGGVKKLQNSMFEGCTSLKNIYLENGLEHIGKNAFFGCVSLVDFTIPNTVTEIGAWAFRGCHSLKNLVIPNSVHTFGNDTGVILDCSNLETVVLSDNITRLCGRTGHGELSECPKLRAVYIGNSVTEIQNSPAAYIGILGGNEAIKTLILPEGFSTIGSCVLKNSINLEALVLPKTFSKFQLNLADNQPFAKYNGSTPEQPLPKLYLYGFKGTYAEEFANQYGFPFVDISVATPTNSKVLINGKEVAFTAYNIGGNNYFKLRDIAAAINGTGKNFNVGWDGSNNAISLNSKTAYINVGGELVVNTNAYATEPNISNPKIFVDGKLTTFMAFNIADNNYIKLRDLGEVFDFGVTWNEATQTIEINTNNSYN